MIGLFTLIDDETFIGKEITLEIAIDMIKKGIEPI